jgi:outer membrane protein TolC
MEKQAFGVKEMKKELEMLEAEYEAAEKKVLFDIRDAYARIDANKKLITLYETAYIPQADEALKTVIKGYETKNADLFSVLDSQRTLLDFKTEHYKAILELRIALADLERSIGVELDRL